MRFATQIANMVFIEQPSGGTITACLYVSLVYYHYLLSAHPVKFLHAITDLLDGRV
jgi:hypothetical protein